MQQIKDLFDQIFKFKNNEPLRHKGDNKSSHSTDMGLLVVNRLIVEDIDADGNQTFERLYHCRVVRFSGSGEVMQFKERELLSMDEYMQDQLTEERKRNDFRKEMDELQKEIFAAYGVQRFSVVKLKANPSKEFKVTGFKGENKRYLLSLREVGGIDTDREDLFINSPDEIELIS